MGTHCAHPIQELTVLVSPSASLSTQLSVTMVGFTAPGMCCPSALSVVTDETSLGLLACILAGRMCLLRSHVLSQNCFHSLTHPHTPSPAAGCVKTEIAASSPVSCRHVCPSLVRCTDLLHHPPLHLARCLSSRLNLSLGFHSLVIFLHFICSLFCLNARDEKSVSDSSHNCVQDPDNPYFLCRECPPRVPAAVGARIVFWIGYFLHVGVRESHSISL